MLQLATLEPRGTVADTNADAKTCLETNSERMRYSRFRELGLPGKPPGDRLWA